MTRLPFERPGTAPESQQTAIVEWAGHRYEVDVRDAYTSFPPADVDEIEIDGYVTKSEPLADADDESVEIPRSDIPVAAIQRVFAHEDALTDFAMRGDTDVPFDEFAQMCVFLKMIADQYSTDNTDHDRPD